ncbi:MAG: nitroreductase [Clostridia bacterium]|nr:nitroreductase [Clostridia bacterium]
MNETIRKRKSIRKYDMEALSAQVLDQIRTQAASCVPLFPDIRVSVEIASKTKGMFGIKAPHYLIFRSEQKHGSNGNVGFIGQQMSLYFTELGLGSCWLGMAKPEEKDISALPFTISMAFGKPAEPLFRDLTDFKRKPLIQISEGADDRLESARLAPSGMNAQNWYFIAAGGQIHCYRKKSSSPLGLVSGKLSEIDMGIALCHIMKDSGGFSFSAESGAPERAGYLYAGTVGCA